MSARETKVSFIIALESARSPLLDAVIILWLGADDNNFDDDDDNDSVVFWGPF